ncbi:MAG: hypothetical protein GX849_08640 [Clostridiaceae bacterium]|nr:hypothetical protein [Clostridiaceae bacterium]
MVAGMPLLTKDREYRSVAIPLMIPTETQKRIDSGLVTKMSWAFTVSEDSYNKETRTRTILKIKKVFDVSSVSHPANCSTDISARSWVDGVIEAEKQELLERQLAIAKHNFIKEL